jgi:hypothetical protein
MLKFNDLLLNAGIEPKLVRLVRHQERGPGGTTYQLWRNDRDAFKEFESQQGINRRKEFSAPFWASFVATPDGNTLFIGLSRAFYLGLNQEETIHQIRKTPLSPGSYDLYRLEEVAELHTYVGRLYIDWGESTRAWLQRADRQDKDITKLLDQIAEPEFPGFASFIKNLSDLPAIPPSWITALKATRGVYLLTCPRTKEQYVGSASGESGFWGRWMQYFSNSHGGNVLLKSREISDYQISILQTVSFNASEKEVIAIESVWKQKLQSREMGLNRN